MDYKNNIAIIGANKSLNYEVAKMLADKLEMYFLDSDEYIEYEADIPPALLINDYGAKFFLKLESDKIKRLESFDNAVINTSATAMLSADNIKNLSKFCYLVLINADRELTIERLLNDSNALLVSEIIKNKAQLFTNLNAVAIPLADVVVVSDNMAPVQLCNKIIDKLGEIFG